MKTKDFIKMLQEEDPSGEAIVTVNGEAIRFVEKLEGYWNGPSVSLTDNQEKFRINNVLDKVVIHTYTLEDWVYEQLFLNKRMTLEELYQTFDIDFSAYASEHQKEEATVKLKQQIKNHYDNYKNYEINPS